MVSVTASYQQSIAIYKTSYHCLLSLNLLCLGYALVPPFQIQPAITPLSADSYKNPGINCSWMGPTASFSLLSCEGCSWFFFLSSFPSPSPSKGRHEDITRDYFEAKKRYEGIMESLKNLKRYNRVSFPLWIVQFSSSGIVNSRSDWHVTSPHIIYTLYSKHAVRILILIT